MRVKESEKSRIPEPRSISQRRAGQDNANGGGRGRGGKNGGRGGGTAFKQVDSPFCQEWFETGDCPRLPDCTKWHWTAAAVKEFNSLGVLYVAEPEAQSGGNGGGRGKGGKQ